MDKKERVFDSACGTDIEYVFQAYVHRMQDMPDSITPLPSYAAVSIGANIWNAVSYGRGIGSYCCRPSHVTRHW